MREFIRVAALGLALIATPAFAKAPSATSSGAVCVPQDIAVARLEARGFEMLGTAHASFTENSLLYFRLGDTVVAVISVDGCVVPASLTLGTFKPEYGI